MTEPKKEDEKKDLDCVDEKCDFKMSKDFKSAEDKVEDLKKAIKELGYKIEETEEGIRISE
ncbi:MAG: hypothetical protein A2288_01455 [Candidatus Moranbacteria bacterium RIFOXYA12_FULL_44_15]|nr:MAG: hypothetical protein A2288_01455 [Candidatus Moranbacteria bacterium RIFOXYA12_FULL_44_15]OGI34371.1 MAG: hypothetical protein A2259_04630 [Candidatus Moranbacteria bacterium RIFOXYA2_FULL_43_15]